MELASLLPIVAIFLVFWLLIIRPASRRQKQLKGVQQNLAVGDRVITSSGLFGTVAHIADDRIGLQVADGVVLQVARAAIGGLTEEVAGESATTEPTPDHEPTPDQERDRD